MKEQSGQGKYIYGIVNGGDCTRFAFRGIDGREAYMISFQNLAAVVSDSPMVNYKPLPRRTKAHQFIVENLMRDHVVIPVRFGTVVTSADDVERLLEQRFDELQSLLGYMEGKVEVRLKAYWKREALFAETIASAPRIRSLRDALIARPGADSDCRGIKLANLMREAMIRKRDEIGNGLLDELRALVVESKTDRLATDNMVLNAAFLVDKGHQKVFDAKVRELKARHTGWLSFRYSGPAPRLSFANVVVQREDRA